VKLGKKDGTDALQFGVRRLISSAKAKAVDDLFFRFAQFTRFVVFDSKNIPACPSGHRALGSFQQCFVFMHATTVSP